MNAATLLRLSGLAACAGGLLRIASALPLPLGAVGLEALWTTIDVLLPLGLIGIYLVRAEKLGLMGFAGFVLAMASLSFIGGPDADVFGFSTYEQGAAALAVSLLGLSIAWLRAGERPWGAPICWFLSVVAAGLLAPLPPPWPALGFQLGGALFGLAFVWAGWALVRR